MRLNAVLLSSLYSAAALFGQVRAEDEAADASTASVVESSTSSAIEKPTFTVSRPRVATRFVPSERAALTCLSPLISKLPFSSSSQMTGTHDGLHRMPRRKTPKPLKTGRTLVPGLLRSPLFLRLSRGTKG